MKKGLIKSSLILFFMVNTLSFAGRPLKTEDAEVIGKGEWEFEIGYNFIKNNDKTKNEDFEISFKTGIFNRCELGIGIPYVIKDFDEKVNEFRNFELKSKISILKKNSIGLGVSFSFTPDGDEGDTRYSYGLILSKEIKRSNLHLNLGRFSLKTSGKNEYFLSYSGAIEFEMSDKLNFCCEIVGEKNGEDILEMLLGINYKLNKNLIFDLGLGFGLNDYSPDWRLTTGLTLNW